MTVSQTQTIIKTEYKNYQIHEISTREKILCYKCCIVQNSSSS